MDDDRRRLDAHRSLTMVEQRLEGMMPDKWDSADGQSGQRATDAEIAKYRENIAANCIHEYSDDEMDRILNRLAAVEADRDRLQSLLNNAAKDASDLAYDIGQEAMVGTWEQSLCASKAEKIISACLSRREEALRSELDALKSRLAVTQTDRECQNLILGIIRRDWDRHTDQSEYETFKADIDTIIATYVAARVEPWREALLEAKEWVEEARDLIDAQPKTDNRIRRMNAVCDCLSKIDALLASIPAGDAKEGV